MGLLAIDENLRDEASIHDAKALVKIGQALHFKQFSEDKEQLHTKPMTLPGEHPKTTHDSDSMLNQGRNLQQTLDGSSKLAHTLYLAGYEEQQQLFTFGPNAAKRNKDLKHLSGKGLMPTLIPQS